LQGRDLYRRKSPEADQKAIGWLERAIKIDPRYADPYAVLGAIKGIRWTYSKWGVDPSNDITEGRQLIRRALQLNGELPRAHSHLGWTFLSSRDFDSASEHLNIGVSLNPNDVDVLLLKAYALCYMGEPEESIRICDELIRLNPLFPQWYLDVLATAQFVAGRYQDSLNTYEHVRDLFPENAGWMAACYAHLGRTDEARVLAGEFVERVQRIWKGPRDASVSDYVTWWLRTASPFKFEKDLRALEAGIWGAGLRE
jgi:adenylate cyclase